MEPSPLTQDVRPEVFQPKIIGLYEILFRDIQDDEEDRDYDLSEGFWEEFFLLRPDREGLKRIVGALSPNDLLRAQEHSQQLFRNALKRIRSARAPSDINALDTLTFFLDAALGKKYTNPSSDTLAVLCGIDDADSVFSDFVATLDAIIRNGRSLDMRFRAVRTTLMMLAVTFHTGVPSYFTHRDLFPSIMKYIHDSDDDRTYSMPAFYLLGLLVNYDKFEFQNPYRQRLEDFVNAATMQRIITGFGATCSCLREGYVAVQDDMPEGWTLSSTLNMIGLRVLAPASRPKTPILSPEETKAMFAALPGREIGILLSTYDFANANKVFCSTLVTLAAEKKGDPSPLNSFLSLTSYLFQHAHRSSRTTLYSHLSLYILQILVEDKVSVKHLCSDEHNMSVRLCRQRQPFLPVVRGDRVPASIILDLIVDGINHNLRRRLDVQYYILCLGVLFRLLSHLTRASVRISYHWSELWRALLSLFRFLSSYANDIKTIHRSSEMVDQLVNLLVFAMSNGESFLPDAASFDDLVYKVVEAGDVLVKFRDTFDLAGPSGSHSISTLLNVSSHYRTLLEGDEKGKASSKNRSPQEVSDVIKKGYETLSIEAGGNLDRFEKFREVDHKSMLKKITRVAVGDARELLLEK